MADGTTCARRCPKCSRSALPVRDRDRGPQHFIVGFIGGLVVGFLLPIRVLRMGAVLVSDQSRGGWMSEVSPMLDEFKWASPEERGLAEMDAVLFGNCFVKRGEDGLMRRIDPTTIKVMEA